MADIRINARMFALGAVQALMREESHGSRSVLGLIRLWARAAAEGIRADKDAISTSDVLRLADVTVMGQRVNGQNAFTDALEFHGFIKAAGDDLWTINEWGQTPRKKGNNQADAHEPTPKFMAFWKFWREHPAHKIRGTGPGGRKVAWRAWFTREVERTFNADKMIKAASVYLQDCAAIGCPTKHAATWINQEEFRDWIARKPRVTGRSDAGWSDREIE